MLHTVIQLLVGNHRILPSLVPMQATLSFSMLHVERERERERESQKAREGGREEEGKTQRETETERERERERGRERQTKRERKMTSTLLCFTEFVRSRSKVLRQITMGKTLMVGPLMKKMVRMI